MRIAIGADHAGFELKQVIGNDLRHLGHEVIDVGTGSVEPVDYPDYAKPSERSSSTGRQSAVFSSAAVGWARRWRRTSCPASAPLSATTRIPPVKGSSMTI